jgi:hypothetical protein
MAGKISDEDLRCRLRDCPVPGSTWRHYKTGGLYRVVGRCILEANRQPLVVYQNVESAIEFARPLSEWVETVAFDGVYQPRFSRVS